MPTRDRIAIVTSSYPTGPHDPSGHFVASEARALCLAGHAVTVFAGGAAGVSTEAGGPLVIRVWDGGATGWPGLVSRLKARPLRGLGLCAWLAGVRRELTRRGPFDRVVGHFLVPIGFPLLLATNLRGASLELVVHGSDARLLARLPAPLGRHVLRSLGRIAHFRTVSHELADLLRSLAAQSLSGRLRVEPLPVDTSAAPSRAAARAELGLAEDARLIVIVSRLISSKRTHEALAAAMLVPESLTVVVGDGPQLAALEREYPAARFVGRVARPRALTWIAAADVLLSASQLEGAPSAIREARALNVPVVTSAAGDLTRWAAVDTGLWVVH